MDSSPLLGLRLGPLQAQPSKVLEYDVVIDSTKFVTARSDISLNKAHVRSTLTHPIGSNWQ